MSGMKESHIGYAQVALTFCFCGGYFCILGGFMLGYVKVPLDFRDAFVALLGVVTANVGSIVAYWFSRQRPDAPRATVQSS